MSLPRRYLELREWFVYVISDASGSPLYVGMSYRPEARWREHQKNPDATWTAHAARFRLVGPYHYRQVKAVERETIRRLDPIGNVVHTPRAIPMREEAARKRSDTFLAKKINAWFDGLADA